MNRMFADTSFFIALYEPGDEFHQAARRFVAQPFRLLTSQWVLAEFAAAFSRPPDRERAAELIAMLEGYPERAVVSASDDWFQRGLALYRARPDKAWSLVDCISFEIMQQFHLTEALTADHHFEQAGFIALLK